MRVLASQLRKGDRITDGRLSGTIATNPMIPKRKPGHVTFLVRVKETMYNVCISDTERVERISSSGVPG